MYDKPLTAKVVSVVAATTFAYFGNRYWTFRHRGRTSFGREYVLFFVLNGVGLAIASPACGSATTRSASPARWPTTSAPTWSASRSARCSGSGPTVAGCSRTTPRPPTRPPSPPPPDPAPARATCSGRRPRRPAPRSAPLAGRNIANTAGRGRDHLEPPAVRRDERPRQRQPEARGAATAHAALEHPRLELVRARRRPRRPPRRPTTPRAGRMRTVVVPVAVDERVLDEGRERLRLRRRARPETCRSRVPVRRSLRPAASNAGEPLGASGRTRASSTETRSASTTLPAVQPPTTSSTTPESRSTWPSAAVASARDLVEVVGGEDLLEPQRQAR